MYQIEKFIKASDRPDNKRNPKSGGKTLYYGRRVDPTLLVVLGSILEGKSKGTT